MAPKTNGTAANADSKRGTKASRATRVRARQRRVENLEKDTVRLANAWLSENTRADLPPSPTLDAMSTIIRAMVAALRSADGGRWLRDRALQASAFMRGHPREANSVQDWLQSRREAADAIVQRLMFRLYPMPGLEEPSSEEVADVILQSLGMVTSITLARELRYRGDPLAVLVPVIERARRPRKGETISWRPLLDRQTPAETVHHDASDARLQRVRVERVVTRALEALGVEHARSLFSATRKRVSRARERSRTSKLAASKSVDT